MFDDQEKSKKADEKRVSETSSYHEGQKITDSPFRLNETDSAELDNNEKKENISGDEFDQEKSYPPKSPLAEKEEPEDMFASLEQENNSSEILDRRDNVKDSANQEAESSSQPGPELKTQNPSQGSSLKKELEPGGRIKLNSPLVKYLVLFLIAVVVIAIVSFWGSSVLISPTS